MASTYATTYAVAANAFNALDLNNVSTVKIHMDFSDQSMAQNTTATLFTIPAGTIILGAMIKVVTAQSDVTDVDLGYTTDGTTGAELLDGISLATTGYVFTAGITTPLHITATNYLVLTNKDAQAISTAVIDVIVLMVDARVA